MLFNSFQFAVFFVAVVAALRLLPRRAWFPVLLSSSLLFYAMWLPAYLLLLLADIGINWLLLRAITSRRAPRLALGASVAITLGLLGGFKYAALAVETVLPLLERSLDLHPAVPEVFLPLGISFFSFQILGLAIDAYRRKGGEVPPLSRYMLFVAFFPQLIAGPILRGRELLPQLERGPDPNPERTRRGMWLLASGLGKKVIFADFLLSGFVDAVFDVPGLASAPFHLIALYSFAFQIYFDFSGYTDMARGLALLMGFELPLNFAEPYLSRDPGEFWRRWHITLSQWLRDYLYISLGGNRRGSIRTLLNLMATMLLGGLWHGAAWSFVVWGGVHGLLLVLHRLLGRSNRARSERLAWREVPAIVAMFHATCLAWVFFRAPNFAEGVDYLVALFGNYGGEWPILQIPIVAACLVLHVGERYARLRLPAMQQRMATRAWGPALEGAAFGALVALCVAVSGSGAAFIYFQF